MALNEKVTEFERFKTEQRERDQQKQREMIQIKEMLRNYQPGTLTRTPQLLRIAEEEILRWSENLNSARVTRWGGVISTPGKINTNFRNEKSKKTKI